MVTVNKSWSEWIQPGHFIRYLVGGIWYFYSVEDRDWAHIEYTWKEAVDAGAFSGVVPITDLEVTENYQMYQCIFGFQPNVLMYVNVPLDTKRHGVSKRALPDLTYRRVAHYEYWQSPKQAPSFETEFNLVYESPKYPGFEFIHENPAEVAPTLDIIIAKLRLELLGTKDTMGVLHPAMGQFEEIVTKLNNKTVPCRPVNLFPVRGPAVAPGS